MRWPCSRAAWIPSWPCARSWTRGSGCWACILSRPFFGKESELPRWERLYGVESVAVDIRQQYVDMLLAPSQGYGKWLNPCIDCKITMLTHASGPAAEIRRAVSHLRRGGGAAAHEPARGHPQPDHQAGRRARVAPAPLVRQAATGHAHGGIRAGGPRKAARLVGAGGASRRWPWPSTTASPRYPPPAAAAA